MEFDFDIYYKPKASNRVFMPYLGATAEIGTLISSCGVKWEGVQYNHSFRKTLITLFTENLTIRISGP